MALYAYPQNGPFIQMKRKGYTVMKHKENIVNAALTWDYDYIVIEDNIYMDKFEERKEVLSRLSKVADNGRISVCTLSDTIVCESSDVFFAK